MCIYSISYFVPLSSLSVMLKKTKNLIISVQKCINFHENYSCFFKVEDQRITIELPGASGPGLNLEGRVKYLGHETETQWIRSQEPQVYRHDKIFSSIASKQINIRWIRTGYYPFLYPRQAVYNISLTAEQIWFSFTG